MNVLILAAGERGNDETGSRYPIWLSEIEGRLIIERQVKALDVGERNKFIFAFMRDQVESYHVDDIVRQITPDASIATMSRQTAGAACTALLAIGHMDPEGELVVASATDYVDVDYEAVLSEFRARGADAGVLTFDSLHPRYSFVSIDNDGWVVEAAEKRPISRSANAGFYWYARAQDFIDSIKMMILKDAHVNGVFYISPSLNELILRGRKIASHHLAASQYHPIKDRRQVDHLEQQMEGRSRHAP